MSSINCLQETSSPASVDSYVSMLWSQKNYSDIMHDREKMGDGSQDVIAAKYGLGKGVSSKPS